MKTFQKLLTNSLLFAENRLCRKEGAEKPAAAPEQGFEIGQVVEGYGLTKEDKVTVEKIEKVKGYDKVTLSDKTVIEKVEFEFDKDGKKEPTWLTCRKLNTGTYVDIDGEQPMEFIPSQRDLMPESEAIKQLEEKANEAKKKLEEAKKKALERVSEPTKEQATQAIEEKYKKTAEKIDTLLAKAKKEITEEREDDQVEKSTAEELAKAFGIEVEKTSEEGEEAIGFEAEFKGKLKNPEDLHKWLEDPKNRERMRGLVLVGDTGAKKYTVDFGKLKTALNLSDKEYRIAERNLRIGNLLEDDRIKKITSVKTKGKEMTAKYFYEGGEKVKGVYTEKNKYIPIWNGTEISIEPAGTDLEVVKSGNKDFEKKIAKVKATKSAEDEATAEGGAAAAEKAPGAPEATAKAKAEAAAATSPESRTAQGLDSTPVKPLEPTESKDVAGAKTFNDITYKPNGSNFDIIDASTKEVTNTVDADTLAVLEGREVPTEKWMKKVIGEKFTYLKDEAKSYYMEGTKVMVKFGDDERLTAGYDLKTRKKDIYAKGTTEPIGQFLKDTTPGTIAQLQLDNDTPSRGAGKVEKNNFGESVNDELSKKIINEDWAGAVELLVDQENPDPKVLAIAILAGGPLTAVNTDKLKTLKSKISPAKITQIWKENGKKIRSRSLDSLELFNGGDLDPALQEAVMDCELDDADEAKKSFFEKYKSNPKVAEWYLKEEAETGADLLLLLKDYAGNAWTDELTLKVADSYDDVATLDLTPQEKQALKEKIAKHFKEYLAKNVKTDQSDNANYVKIHNVAYGYTTALNDPNDKPSPEVYASYVASMGEDNVFSKSCFDGTGWVAKGEVKYLDAYLEIMSDVPTLNQTNDKDRQNSFEAAVMERAKQSENPIAKLLAAQIELKVLKEEEGTEGKIAAIKTLKDIVESKNEKTQKVAYEELEQMKDPIGELLTDEKARKELGFPNGSTDFNAWLNKFKSVEQTVEIGENISRRGLRDVIVKNTPEKLEELAKEASQAWVKVELYLALGLKGKAKETADGMTDEVAKNYYSSLLAENEDKKLEDILAAAKAIQENTSPGIADLEMQVMVFEQLYALNKDVIEGDDFAFSNKSKLEVLAEANVTDPDAIAARLRAKILTAQVEMDQCGQKPGKSKEEACDPGELVKEVRAYLDAAETPDLLVAKKLYNLVNTNKIKIPEDKKEDYAAIMVKLSKAEKNDSYTEGLEDYITQDAAYLESKGKFLDAAKAINTSDEKNIPKKKALLKQALETEKADKALVAVEYESLNDEESNGKAVDLYIEIGKYDEAIAIMSQIDPIKVSEGFVKAKLDDLVAKDQASKAADLCFARNSYKEAIEDVYMKGNGLKIDVKLDHLFSAASENKLSYDKIFDLLMLEDNRTKDKFTGASDDQKKAFLQAVKDKLTTDTIKEKIKGKLGIEQNLEDFLKDAKEPAQNEAQETQKYHKYTWDKEKKVVTIDTVDGKTFKVKVEMPETFYSDILLPEHFPDIGGGMGFTEDEINMIKFYLNEKNELKFAFINDEVNASYNNGVLKVTKKTPSQPTETPPTQPPAQKPAPQESPTPRPTEPEPAKTPAEQPAEQPTESPQPPSLEGAGAAIENI